ncbi:MAG: hypothetical protein LJE64_11500 [Desulfofustis sp.]|jgi:hypothetical protein|nr:hypothetical protein [Desulfofustis sp.]
MLGNQILRLSGGMHRLEMLEFAAAGSPLSIFGIFSMTLIGTKLLSGQGSMVCHVSPRQNRKSRSGWTTA